MMHTIYDRKRITPKRQKRKKIKKREILSPSPPHRISDHSRKASFNLSKCSFISPANFPSVSPMMVPTKE